MSEQKKISIAPHGKGWHVEIKSSDDEILGAIYLTEDLKIHGDSWLK